LIVDEVAARNVVEHETVALQKSDNLPGLTAGSFGIFEVE
jgi:hypothetical protein